MPYVARGTHTIPLRQRSNIHSINATRQISIDGPAVVQPGICPGALHGPYQQHYMSVSKHLRR